MYKRQSQLISRLYFVAECWWGAVAQAIVLDVGLREGLLAINSNLEAFLVRVREDAETMSLFKRTPGHACVAISRNMTVSVFWLDLKSEALLHNTRLQERAGLKLMTVDDFQIVVCLAQKDVLQGNWLTAVDWLNINGSAQASA